MKSSFASWERFTISSQAWRQLSASFRFSISRSGSRCCAKARTSSALTHPCPKFFGAFMVATSILYFIGGLAFAALTFAAGRRLRVLRSRRFVVVAAAINCIAFPFGTILGVFTLVVLNRESVRAMFES